MKVRRHGFTLVELLVAIGIIALLMTIAVIAYRGLTTSGKVNQTHVTINAMQGMMAALDREAGFRIIVPFDANSNKYPSPYPLPDMKAIDKMPAEAQSLPLAKILQRELEVMQGLTRVPDNKKALQQMPTQFVKTPATFNGGLPSKLPLTLQDQAFPVDAWGRFLIFAPAEGVRNVTVAKVKLDVFKAPDGRPFIISAGPDGDFFTGDDNIYSFQQ